MAITSIGYAGTVTPAAWADLVAAFGADYGVAGAGDWKVTTVAGQDRTVTIASGTGYGRGILDTSDAAATVQLDTVATGSRWDTVVARRTWGVTNATTFAAVQGTTTLGVSNGLTHDPGVLDEQPLALVQVTAGQQVPTSVVDVRCWKGNGGLVAASSEALGYLGTAGSTIWINGIPWVREVTNAGTLAWVAGGQQVDVIDGALHGTYAGQQVKHRVRRRSYRTDGNGDAIVMPTADFNGVLTAHMFGASTYPLIFAFRVDTNGNLVARVWDYIIGLRTNTTFGGVADVLYW